MSDYSAGEVALAFAKASASIFALVGLIKLGVWASLRHDVNFGAIFGVTATLALLTLLFLPSKSSDGFDGMA